MKKMIIFGSAVAGLTAGIVGYKVRRKQKESRSEKHITKNRVLILVNHEVVIYNFRLELVERLLSDGYEVHISTPGGERVEKLREMGAIIHDISFDRHGMNPAEELRILRYYRKLMRTVKPLIAFGYTIKPNIYGAMAANHYHIPFVANITGLGTAVDNGGLSSRVMLGLYKIAFGGKKGKIQRVFFQNEENEQFFTNNGIALNVHGLLPGSGVNKERFPYINYQKCGDGKEDAPVRFAFISRIMEEKGIDQYLDAAETIKKEYPATEFHIAGFFEPEYERSRMDRLCNNNTVIYDGNIEDVSEYMGQMHCIIHPTYYPEGISNVLLEACATGRPIITTNRSGCREVVDEGVNGYMIPCQDSTALIESVDKFLKLSWETKKDTGIEARKKVEREFDRKIVVDSYMNEINAVGA